MRSIFKSIPCVCLLFMLPVKEILAQHVTNQVIVVSGGVFAAPGNHVTFASYRPDNGSFTVFDSIPADYTNHALAYGNILYANAGNSLYKFNLDTYHRLNDVTINGISNFAGYGDHLVVSRGFGVSTNYVQVYDTASLTLQDNISGISNEARGILVIGDTAYVAHNMPGTVDMFPPFGIYADSIGYIAVIDLVNRTLARDIDLGTAGAGASEVFAYGSKVVTINRESASITIYDPSTGSHTTTATGTGVAFNGAGVYNNLLHGHFSFDGIGSFDLDQPGIEDTVIVEGTFARAIHDSIHRLFYATQTDYFSYGRLMIFDENGNPLDTFVTGISPEAIAIDYRLAPVADFTASATSVTTADTVEFTQTSLNKPAFFYWEFTPSSVTYVDGTDSASANPRVVFNNQGSYSVQLTASIFGANSAENKMDYISVTFPVSVGKNGHFPFSIYPNPASDLVMIQLQKPIPGSVALHDMNGKLLINKTFHDESKIILDIEKLARGVYTLAVEINDQVSYQKLVKLD